MTKLNAAGTSLLYSTYLGGSGSDQSNGIAVDGSGLAYVTGRTFSTDFPTVTPFQATYAGGDGDAFVTQLDAAGTSLLYSTYLGGSGSDQSNGIAVDGSGLAYVTGRTHSTDFPTVTPFQATLAGGSKEGDAFVTKLSATGTSLLYSTFLGGSGGEQGNGIALDGSGQAYVTGSTSSTDFPTATPVQATNAGSGDAFVTKLSATGTSLLYSTYLGGSGSDQSNGIAVDATGQAYVTGFTFSTDFPMVTPVQSTHAGGIYDVFVTQLDAAGTSLLYSTYLGGNGIDQGQSIAVDATGQAYVTGYTTSTNFPTSSPLQATHAGVRDAFVTKLNAAGTSLLYSTYLGGSNFEQGIGIAVDVASQAYVTGYTQSTNFPTSSPLQATLAGVSNAFVTKISDSPANQVPVCSAAQANPASLWTPNGQFVPIVVTGVTDQDGDSVTISVTRVTQDEPVIGKSDKTSPDAVFKPSSSSVRAERLNSGNGRVYQISFTADDGNGGSCTGAVKVGVPLNLKKGLNAIDDGQVYDSTIP
ncbi:MAG: SBBP repeat-containing protein [Nitrospirales bacterium]